MKARRFTAFLLAAMFALALGATAFADDSTTATVPVTLTVSNEYRAVNVTVPASLPVEVRNGKVITADNAYIKNNSTSGAIQVTGVTVADAAYKVGSYDSFTGNKTIALSINGCKTSGAGKMNLTTGAFPVIPAGEQQKLDYTAKVSADAPNTSGVEAAKVIFTISIAD